MCLLDLLGELCIGTTYLDSNPVFDSRMKHITLDYHVKQLVHMGKVKKNLYKGPAS